VTIGDQGGWSVNKKGENECGGLKVSRKEVKDSNERRRQEIPKKVKKKKP
jgi:hypothetical protein